MYKYFKLEEFDSPDEPGSGEMMEPAVDNSQRRYLMVEALLDAGFNRIGVAENFIHADMDENKTPNVLWTY